MRTLETYLDDAKATEELKRLMVGIANIGAEISALIRQGPLAGIYGEAGSGNVQGERQQKLDVIANELFLNGLSRDKLVCGLASEEMDHALDIPGGARLLIAFDPLDGSSNIDVNVSIGSIFSILPAPTRKEGQEDQYKPIRDQDFLLPGKLQMAAGYIIYGPTTELVITIGKGVYGFTLDPQWKSWIQTRGPVVIPKQTQEFAINASNARHWYRPVQEYVDELLAGQTGPRGKDFNMRWIASMVADVHRILCRGGVFLYPADQRDTKKPGKLRLLYEANPMALIALGAGGSSSDGSANILDQIPTSIHQRTPLAIGSVEEVSRLEEKASRAKPQVSGTL